MHACHIYILSLCVINVFFAFTCNNYACVFDTLQQITCGLLCTYMLSLGAVVMAANAN